MKKLALMMLFACACASADTIATAKNAVGGITVLTDVPCSNEMGFNVYAQDPNDQTHFGCWWSDDSVIHIRWETGRIRAYTFDQFSVNVKNADRLRARLNKQKTY